MNKWMVLAVIPFFWSSLSQANCDANACWSIKVERLYTNKNGIVYVGTSGDEKVLDCNAKSDVYVTFDLAGSAGEAFYSTLLAAQMANRNVSIRIQNGTENCLIEYITFDS